MRYIYLFNSFDCSFRSWQLIDFFFISIPMRLDAVGIRCVLFDTLVWTKPKRRQRASAGVFRYGRNIFILTVSGTCQVSMGRHRRRQRLGTWLGTIHGSWCINDNDWWRVSVWHTYAVANLMSPSGHKESGIDFISTDVTCRRWTHFLLLNEFFWNQSRWIWHRQVTSATFKSVSSSTFEQKESIRINLWSDVYDGV